MKLTVNGEPHEFDQGATVADLLAVLELGAGWVVVELNRSVVERPAYDSCQLADGDVIEIVKAVAGG